MILLRLLEEGGWLQGTWVEKAANGGGASTR